MSTSVMRKGRPKQEHREQNLRDELHVLTGRPDSRASRTQSRLAITERGTHRITIGLIRTLIWYSAIFLQ